jgi:acyl-coenzyme A thioesterase PaaI-like protein
MNETTIDFENNNCFVCGPSNPIGLRIKFRIDGDVCRGEFKPGEHHVGYNNITHGGIIFSLLDDVMANWLFLKNEIAQTAKCELRYRRPLPINETVLLEGRLIKRKGQVAVMHGLIIHKKARHIVAESNAKFMIVKP